MDIPQKTNVDKVYTSAKAVFSAIPFVGGSISEIFGAIISSPIEKRKMEWMQMVVDEINLLKQKNESLVLELLDDENFQTLLISSTIIALKTHQVEKRNRLKNAIFNSLKCTERYEINQQFLNFIDELSIMHLLILEFINDFQEQITLVNSIQRIYNILYEGTIDETVPKLKKIELTAFRFLLKDLESKGLVILSVDLEELENQVHRNSKLLTSGGGNDNKLPYIKITQFGKDFLDFIEE